MKRILLTQGKAALVDNSDYDELCRHAWNYSTPQGYARRKSRDGIIYMHRQILDAPAGTDVDHINGDKLDNRRSNLRLVTRTQNLYNMAPRSGTSRFKGVSWHAQRNKWAVYIQVDRKSIYLGLFTDEIEAARAYNRAALEYIGEYARLNEV